MSTLRKTIIAIAAIAVIGFAINAFAHSGMGWGGGWNHMGGGMHYQEGYGNDGAYDRDAYRQFDQEREAFFNQTREIRTQLYEKERELQAELNKEEPDTAKASRLQREISDLQARFDQKRVEHMIEMRKLNPNVGRGYGAYGHMMGYGSRGGYCWR